MQFEQVLADCIEALDRGDTIEACLARYPQHALALHPLLALAAELQQQPKPRLSTAAFAQIRATLATKAQQAARPTSTAVEPKAQLSIPTINGRHDQSMRRRPGRAGHRTIGRQATGQQQQTRPPHRYRLATPQPAAGQAQGQRRLLRTLSMGLAACLLVSLVVFMRQVTISLPGAPLYSVKTVGEKVQGMVMTAAGDGAQWHAQQATLRLGELARLPQTAQAQQATLAQSAAAHVTSALAEGTALPQAARVEFLTAWQADLQQLDAELQQAGPVTDPAIEAVQAALTAVALTLAPSPTVLPAITEPTPLTTTPVPVATQATTVVLSATLTLTPSLPTTTTGVVLSPTVTITATAAPTVSTVLTVTPTPVLIPTATASATELPVVVPTATPFPVITGVMPQEDTSSNEPRDDNQEEAAPNREDAPSDDANTQTGAEAPSTPAGTTITPLPTLIDETATPVVTSDATAFLTPTPLTTTTSEAETTVVQTPVPVLTPAPTQQPTQQSTQQPTSIATEAATKVTNPVQEYPTVRVTTPPEPATPEPTRTPKPTATAAPTETARPRRRTPEPTAPPAATVEPTQAIAP